ncbi:hypothetical protein LguiA_014143 [Lonicera macranthoides]
MGEFRIPKNPKFLPKTPTKQNNPQRMEFRIPGILKSSNQTSHKRKCLFPKMTFTFFLIKKGGKTHNKESGDSLKGNIENNKKCSN